MSENNQESFLDEAFIAEISESQSKLSAYILKLVGNYHHAKDILQETNILLWKKRMDWDPSTTFLKWAYRVAYFQTKGYFRDQKREKSRLTFSDELLDLLAQDSPTESEDTRLREALDGCLAQVEPEKREALLERYQGETSVEELARRFGQTPNTFSQGLRRLRSSLSKCIESKLQTTP